MQQLISICIPTFNGQAYLVECLDSVVNQSYKNIEILIVDDNSEDATLSIVQKYIKRDPRIQLIKNESRLGLVANWNKCLKEASGDWLKLMFQDDIMLPDAVEQMCQLGQSLGVDLVLSDRTYLCEDPRRSAYFDGLTTLGKSVYANEKLITPDMVIKVLVEDRLKYNFLGEPIVGLFRRRILENYRYFNEDLKQIADFEYWLRIATDTNIGFVNEPLHVFRVHDQSVSTQNMITRGVNPSYGDRVLLTLDLLESPVYANMRSIIGYEENETIVSFITQYVQKIGFWRTMWQVSWRIIFYYNFGIFSLFKKSSK